MRSSDHDDMGRRRLEFMKSYREGVHLNRRMRTAALAVAWACAVPIAGFADGLSVKPEGDGISARAPLFHRRSLRAHVGSVPVPVAPGPDATQPLWRGGVGLEYRLSRNLKLGAGWERHLGSVNPGSGAVWLDSRN